MDKQETLSKRWHTEHWRQIDQAMNYIKAIMPIFSQDFAYKIKQAIPSEAMVFGHCVPMPLQIKIRLANPHQTATIVIFLNNGLNNQVKTKKGGKNEKFS